MLTQEVLNYFVIGNEIEKLRLQIVISCAPVIKGIKAGGMIILSKDMAGIVWNSLLKSELSVHILYQSSQKIILYVYQKELLTSVLKKPNVQEFLKIYGYLEEDTQAKLKILTERVKIFYREKEEFPHEIGVFLEYPLEDVIGFIKNQGRHFLLSGYWKVYHDIEKAKEICRSYDRAKEELVKDILDGKTLTELWIGK